MPAKSREQQQMIYAKRSQYGSRDKAPEDWKWVFDSDWNKVEEEKIVPYKRLFENKFTKKDTQKILDDIDKGKKHFSKEEFNILNDAKYDISSGVSLIDMYGVKFLHLNNRRFKIKMNKDKSFDIVSEK